MDSHFGSSAAAALRAILVTAVILRSGHGQSCGGSLTGSGTFATPGYPGLYPNNVICQWNLTANETAGGPSVQIFFSAMSLQTHSDVLEIYSGGILMGLIQSNTPAQRMVFGPSVSVVFRSDGSGRATGFSVVFNSINPMCSAFCSSGQCVVWSPNFPYPFPRGSKCTWRVRSNVAIQAVEMTTMSPRPFTGNLSISDIFSNGSQARETYFSSAPLHPVKIMGELVEINFLSELCRSGTGFMMSVAAKLSQCGGQLVGQGTFSTPNYPSPYARLSICVWRLTALPGMRVQLNITDLQVENRFDYVRVYSDSRLVSSYSGNYLPFSLTLGSEVTVGFQSDTEIQARGMQASFVSVP